MQPHEFRNSLAEMGYEFAPQEARKILQTLENAIDTITVDDYLWTQSLSPTERQAEADASEMTLEEFQGFLDIVAYLFRVKPSQ